MLALADDAALARLVIAATRIPHRARSSWLRKSLVRSTTPSARQHYAVREARRGARQRKGPTPAPALD